MTTIKRWAASAAVLTFLLIVLGGWVRITGSGLGCGDEWPLCNGTLIPPLDDSATLIEWGHRLVASLVAALVAGTAVVAWLRRGARGVGGPSGPLAAAMVSLGLLVLQVLLGAVTVWLVLPASVVVIHLATALALLAALMITAFRCGGPQSIADRAPTVPGGAVSGALALGAVTVLLGALTANLDAGPACQGFPLCNGLVWPLGENSGLARIHWIHRLLAFGLAGHLIGLWIGARRRGRSSTPLTLAAILTVGQLVVAAAMVLTFLQPEWRAIHVAVGTGIWAALVWLRWGDQASGTPASRVKQ